MPKCTHVRTHAETDKQFKNTVPPSPILWVAAGKKSVNKWIIPCRTDVLSGRKGWYSTRMRLSSSRLSQIRPATNEM